MQLGFTRGFGATRVNHNQVHAALSGVLKARGGVKWRNAAPHRYQRIGTYNQADIGLIKGLWACAPFAVQIHGDGLARLIDGGVGKAHWRANRIHKGLPGHGAAHTKIAKGAGVHGHRARTVFGNNFGQLGTNFIGGAV